MNLLLVYSIAGGILLLAIVIAVIYSLVSADDNCHGSHPSNLAVELNDASATFSVNPGSCCNGVRCRSTQQVYFSGFEVTGDSRVPLIYHNSTGWGRIEAITFVKGMELPQLLNRALATVHVSGGKLVFLRFDPRYRLSVLLNTENLRQVKPSALIDKESRVFEGTAQFVYQHKSALLVVEKTTVSRNYSMKQNCETLVHTLGNILAAISGMCCPKEGCSNSSHMTFTETETIKSILTQGSTREKLNKILRPFFEMNLDLPEPYLTAFGQALITRVAHRDSFSGTQIPVYTGFVPSFGKTLNIQELHDMYVKSDTLKQDSKDIPRAVDIYFRLENGEDLDHIKVHHESKYLGY
ncbi:hypothetical protein HDE_04256 [Halotydeus destructor]|nr:hypothetical protein HDE_04256 [Halotydeus destructor]